MRISNTQIRHTGVGSCKTVAPVFKGTATMQVVYKIAIVVHHCCREVTSVSPIVLTVVVLYTNKCRSATQQ